MTKELEDMFLHGIISTKNVEIVDYSSPEQKERLQEVSNKGDGILNRSRIDRKKFDSFFINI